MQYLPRILLVAAVGIAQTVPPQGRDDALSLKSVMTRVGVNQDRVEKLRQQYICRQHIRIVTRHPGGKVVREEIADYKTLPTPTGPQKQLSLLTGRYWRKGKYENFTGEPVPGADTWDADYIRDVRLCLTEQSRCTVASHLFPLTSEEQNKYDFRLLDPDTVEGRNAYRIAFFPKNQEMYNWSGEAFIDANDFQPIRIFTKLSRRVPFFVRALGTNLAGAGYELDYKRQPGNIWFPASYGTEYELHLFFHIKRTISVSMESTFEDPGTIISNHQN